MGRGVSRLRDCCAAATRQRASRATITTRPTCNNKPRIEAKPPMPPNMPCPNNMPNRPAPRNPAAAAEQSAAEQSAAQQAGTAAAPGPSRWHRAASSCAESARRQFGAVEVVAAARRMCACRGCRSRSRRRRGHWRRRQQAQERRNRGKRDHPAVADHVVGPPGLIGGRTIGEPPGGIVRAQGADAVTAAGV